MPPALSRDSTEIFQEKIWEWEENCQGRIKISLKRRMNFRALRGILSSLHSFTWEEWHQFQNYFVFFANSKNKNFISTKLKIRERPLLVCPVGRIRFVGLFHRQSPGSVSPFTHLSIVHIILTSALYLVFLPQRCSPLAQISAEAMVKEYE